MFKSHKRDIVKVTRGIGQEILLYKLIFLRLQLIIMVVFMVVGINSAFAENQYSGVSILIGIMPEEQGMETKLDTVIYNLLVFEFGRYGFSSGKTELDPGSSPESILSSGPDSDLMVFCTHKTNGAEIVLNTKLYDVKTGTILSSASRTSALDLSFDSVITSLTSELVQGAKGELTKIAQNIVPVQKEKVKKKPVVSKAEKPRENVTGTRQKGGLEVFLNAGSTIGVGDSNKSLKAPGIVTGISANYWFFSSLGYLGVGIQSSANLYSITDLNEKASLLLFPIGIIASYSSPTDRLFSIMLQLSSGPAIASLIYEGTKPLAKVLPYVGSDLGISFNFHKKMSLGLKAAYNIYFEEASMLTTLSSSVYVLFRSRN